MKARPSPAAPSFETAAEFIIGPRLARTRWRPSSGWGQCCVAAAAGHGSCNPARAVPI